MSNFQTWKEMMGFNPSWHKRCLSPWDSMVCIADGKYSEGKEIILGKERIHSIQRLQFFTKATNFLLCVKSCVTNSFRDSLCLRVRRARGVLTVIWPTTMLVASGRPKPRILLKRQYWKVKWHGESLEQHPTLPVSLPSPCWTSTVLTVGFFPLKWTAL